MSVMAMMTDRPALERGDLVKLTLLANVEIIGRRNGVITCRLLATNDVICLAPGDNIRVEVVKL